MLAFLLFTLPYLLACYVAARALCDGDPVETAPTTVSLAMFLLLPYLIVLYGAGALA